MGRDCFQPNSVNVDIPRDFLKLLSTTVDLPMISYQKGKFYSHGCSLPHCCFIEGQCPFSSSWFASFTQCLQTLFHNSFVLKLPTSWEIRSIYDSSSSELDTCCMVTTWARPFTTYMDACLPVQNQNFRTAHRCSINIWISNMICTKIARNMQNLIPEDHLWSKVVSKPMNRFLRLWCQPSWGFKLTLCSGVLLSLTCRPTIPLGSCHYLNMNFTSSEVGGPFK